ncbi:CinA family protein [Aeromicrobium sp. CTD01-1L150]|uniref:CinA family protein n=1 Tax=Aeromicrobium sp. CTD01-1L150 TaxID=3341830 RepID=UPI0035C22BF0
MSSPAACAITALRSCGHRVATAESLTGGLLCATLVDVAGASDVVVGGVVAYTPEAKVELLGVDAVVVDERGTVDPETARQMARGALACVPGATLAVATTGVAGPDPSEGHPVGTVFVAVADARDVRVERLVLAGGRAQVREGTVAAALSMLIDRVGEETPVNGR